MEKTLLRELKKQTTDRKEILAKHIFNKVLISRIHIDSSNSIIRNVTI